eukprot:jgi/Orpsp1_1/1174120/evm.model.c7180000049003.1
MLLHGKNYYQNKILDSIQKGDIIKIQSILNKSVKNGIILDMNYVKKVKNDKYYPSFLYFNPLLEVIKNRDINNNTEILKLFIDYANQNNYVLNLNVRDEYNLNTVGAACINNNDIKIIEMLLDYAIEHNITIDIRSGYLYSSEREIPLFNYIIIMNVNEKIHEETPLTYAIKRYSNSYNIAQIIIDYANNHNIILDLKDKNKNNGFTLLLSAIEKRNDSIELIQMIIDYADSHGIILDIKDKSGNREDCLLKAIRQNNIKKVQLFIDYANKHNIILDINYAINHNIILDINKKDKDKRTPLLLAIENDNIKIVKLLIDYANNHNIILDIKGNIIYSIIHNKKYKSEEKFMMFQMLINHANDHNIILGINEDDISRIKNIDFSIVKLLVKYIIDNNIEKTIKNKQLINFFNEELN